MKPFARRPAIATLEFVLSLPVLLFMMVLIFNWATASLAKSEVAIKARPQAYRATARGEPVPGRGQAGAILDGTSAVGLKESSPTRTVPIHPIFRIGPKTAASRHAMLAGTYDHRSVMFPTPNFTFELSRKALDVAAAAGASGLEPPGRSELDQLLKLSGALQNNPLDRLKQLLDKAIAAKKKVDDLINLLKDSGKTQTVGVPPLGGPVPTPGAVAALAKLPLAVAEVIAAVADLAASAGQQLPGVMQDLQQVSELLGNVPNLGSVAGQGMTGAGSSPKQFLDVLGQLQSKFKEAEQGFPKMDELSRILSALGENDY